MTINNKSGNSLLEWDLRLCWLWKRGKLCTEDVELEIVFTKSEKRPRRGKFQWKRGDLQFDLQTFWDCLNYWSHNKLSSEFCKKRETFQASLPDVVLVDKEVFVSVQVPASTPSLLLGRGRVGSVGQVVQVVPATRPWKNICRSRTEVGDWPIRRVGTVDVVVPVADPELLVEAGVVAAHVRDPPTVLVTHVEDLRKIHVEDLQEEVWHSWGTEQSCTNP